MATSAQVRCQLDSNECLSLLQILKAFGGPLTEERAWSVLYQAVKCAQSGYSSSTSSDSSLQCCLPSDTSHIFLHRDGHVHPASFLLPPQQMMVEGRHVATCEQKLISSLGWIIYEALDYGCSREENHVLSPDLEQIIDLMTSVGDESHGTEDEGIERDSGEMEADSVSSNTGGSSGSSGLSSSSSNTVTSFGRILDRCQVQISSTASSSQADAHFRAVCRALVAETLEFSDFLAKVTSSPEEWSDLRRKSELPCVELTELHLADWAKLWMQVIRQLRNGVKLKKADNTRKPIEYELTPYEMMMDDIRSRRYKLRTVMVDGEIPPRVKKDAHAVILEFIRSRPPLRKASERTLRPPARKVSTPVELLMESIRQHDHKGLRPTKSLMVDKTDIQGTSTSATKRKLLKADINLLNSDSEGDDDLGDVPPSSPPRSCLSSPCTDICTPLSSRPESRQSLNTTTAYRCGRDQSPPRRHSIAALTRTLSVNLPSSQSFNSQLSSYTQSHAHDQRRRIPVISNGERDSLPYSGPSSSASSTSSSVSLSSPPRSPLPVLDPLHEHRHLQDEFLNSKQFQEGVDCLSLTLEEMVHIRHVLTKAELEALPLDSSIKEDVIHNKVCFVCLKTRFAVFGQWGQRCKLCQRTVCNKCCSKMRIPTEHFGAVPVSSLSPASPQLATPSIFSSIHLRLPQFRIHSNDDSSNGVESAPSSPSTRRRKMTNQRPNSLCVTPWHQQSLSADNTPRRTRLSATLSKAEREKKTSSTEFPVCRDCQALIEHIVQTSKALQLDTGPVHISIS